jgi:hypothetical protein
MADKDDKYRDKRAQGANDTKKGFFETILTLPFAITYAIFISAFISFLIEATGIWFEWWNEPGVLHSQIMVEQELVYLNDRLDKTILEPITGITVQQAFEYTVGKLFDGLQWLGLAQFGYGQHVGGPAAYLGAAVNMLVLTVIRFMVFVFALVLYVLFGWVGFTIGLLERDKRRAGGGRESGTVFQTARNLVPVSVVVPMMIYLSWPNSIDPVWVMWPASAFFGIAVAYMVASYKKYI